MSGENHFFFNKKREEFSKTIVGCKNNSWKGENVSYPALHSYIQKKFGKASKCENKECTGKSYRYEWANISGKYTRFKKDYKQLCKSCHNKLDKIYKNFGKKSF